MKKFWNFIRNDAGERILRLEGPIDEDNFWGDEVTPGVFRDELEAEEGDVTVWINSPGGNVFAAAQIYTMLCDHKGRVTIKIDAIAASAASVIAMAGDTVLMSPVAMLMVHDPMTIAMGNARDMEKAIDTLNEVKESIINAYVSKSGMSRNKVAKLMSDETWMNARKAVELGFADAILFADGEKGEADEKEVEAVWQPYSTRGMGQAILNRLMCSAEADAGADEESDEASRGETDVDPAEAGVSPETEDSGTDISETDTPERDDDSSGETSYAVAGTQPVIGMNGKTRDGAMPYEILKDKLEWLK